MDLVALLVLLLIYAVILVVGIVAARRFKAKDGITQKEVSLVAGRNLSGVVGVFTMTGILQEHLN